MKRLLLIFLLTGCATVPSGIDEVQREVAQRARPAAATDGELTADKAVAIALANNPRLQATLAEVGIARAELMQANTISNPLFEAEVRWPRDPFRPYELRLAQTLVDLIQLPRRRALGRAAFDAAKLRVTSEVLRFAGDVRMRYYDALAARQQAAMSRTAFEAAQAAAELARKQHQAGNITDLELENEQARYEQAKLDLARAEQRLLLGREALGRLLVMSDVRLPASFPELPTEELTQQQLEQVAAARRLDIDIARREADIMKRRVPLARLAALGEITADVHYQRDAAGARTVGPGIEFPIPLFNNGAAARTRAEAEYVRAAQTLNAMLGESASQLRSANATLQEARARVLYYRDVLLPRRRRIVELTKLEHNAMLIGVYQLLQARQEEAQAARDYLDAQRDYWTARNDLDAALNGVAQGAR
ncbi:MAG TPA: TolC family protein [Thermoanaerobaculia bacterium]|nr:TolC family protein [Thermoanaerobaculia bacterium]